VRPQRINPARLPAFPQPLRSKTKGQRYMKLWILAIPLIALMACSGGGQLDEGQRQRITPVLLPTSTPMPPTPTIIPFTTSSFTVNAGSSYTFTLTVPRGARAEYSYSSNFDLNFRLADPQNNQMRGSTRVYADQGSFTASSGGDYKLTFGNGFSLSTAKDVTLRYRIIPPGGR